MIEFDKAMTRRLRYAYQSAKKQGRDEFKFEGSEYATGYVRYLLEYLDSRWKGGRK